MRFVFGLFTSHEARTLRAGGGGQAVKDSQVIDRPPLIVREDAILHLILREDLPWRMRCLNSL